ncbi:tetratricopeptide repeat protein [Bhargavaea cecembensis]|uniref:tetratricopeptide repeat protein n=1 Tax=Bhargavaea cecembensis TaxID=394098 RepID=UPI00058D3A66|nr:tetratricopeptide repeat protein [Bhargavaea cecembensis]
MKEDAAFEAFDREDWTEAERLYRERLERAADAAEEEAAMHMLAFTLAMNGGFGESRKLYSELLSRAEERHEPENVAIAMHQLGMIGRFEGDIDQARLWFNREKEYRMSRLPEDHAGFSANSYEHGEMGLMAGEPEQALQAFRLALRQGKTAGDDICIACAWRGIGRASQMMHHDPAPAWQLSMEAFRRAGDAKGEAEVRKLMGE